MPGSGTGTPVSAGVGFTVHDVLTDAVPFVPDRYRFRAVAGLVNRVVDRITQEKGNRWSWLEAEGSISLVADTADYATATNLYSLSGLFDATHHAPIGLAAALALKARKIWAAQTGQPRSAAFFKRTSGVPYLRFYPTPSGSSTVEYYYHRKTTPCTAPRSVVDVPEYLRSLVVDGFIVMATKPMGKEGFDGWRLSEAMWKADLSRWSRDDAPSQHFTALMGKAWGGYDSWEGRAMRPYVVVET